MNPKRFLGICILFLIIIFIFIQPAYIGPGGIFVKALINNFWGKALLAVMAMTCLPLAIYVYIREKVFAHRNYNDPI